MRSIWPTNGATSSASTASRPTTNARNTVTTAQVRRITRSTWTTAGFSATAMNRARPTQISTVRTLASSDTAIVNTNTENEHLRDHPQRYVQHDRARCLAHGDLAGGEADGGGHRSGTVFGSGVGAHPTLSAPRRESPNSAPAQRLNTAATEFTVVATKTAPNR